jgi:hypothetical protein
MRTAPSVANSASTFAQDRAQTRLTSHNNWARLSIVGALHGRIMPPGGTMPHIDPARARPRPSVHLSPVEDVTAHPNDKPALHGHLHWSSRTSVAGAPLFFNFRQHTCDNASDALIDDAFLARGALSTQYVFAVGLVIEFLQTTVALQDEKPS